MFIVGKSGEFGSEAIEHFCGEDLCPFATHYPSIYPSASSRPSISLQPSNSTNDDDFGDDGDYL